eukprot:scaffold4184_cov120-Isochrysis_galbana.AAC.9
MAGFLAPRQLDGVVHIREGEEGRARHYGRRALLEPGVGRGVLATLHDPALDAADRPERLEKRGPHRVRNEDKEEKEQGHCNHGRGIDLELVAEPLRHGQLGTTSTAGAAQRKQFSVPNLPNLYGFANSPVYLVHGLRGREAGGAVSPPV